MQQVQDSADSVFRLRRLREARYWWEEVPTLPWYGQALPRARWRSSVGISRKPNARDRSGFREFGDSYAACPRVPPERAGAEFHETQLWAGRFLEAAHRVPSHAMGRAKVKATLLGTASASDADVRAALIDRFGPGREKAIGRKASPGPLYGIRSHSWAALAIAVAFADVREVSPSKGARR